LKIELNLPDWVDERHIYIMAGIEMVAYKLYGEDVIHIKTRRCSNCGECCMHLTPSARLPIGSDGHCSYLEDVGGGLMECAMGVNRPFGCSIGMQRKGLFDHPSCTVEYNP
jgi:hypothetical protein